MTPLKVSTKLTPVISFLVEKHSLALNDTLTLPYHETITVFSVPDCVAIASILRLGLESERQDVFKWMSQIQHRIHHKTMGMNLLPKSGLWLLQKTEFIQWRKSSSSSILWLHGIRKFFHYAKEEHELKF